MPLLHNNCFYLFLDSNFLFELREISSIMAQIKVQFLPNSTFFFSFSCLVIKYTLDHVYLIWNLIMCMYALDLHWSNISRKKAIHVAAKICAILLAPSKTLSQLFDYNVMQLYLYFLFLRFIVRMLPLKNMRISHFSGPQEWLSGSVLKTGRREVADSIPGRPCWPTLSEFSVVFS